MAMGKMYLEIQGGVPSLKFMYKPIYILKYTYNHHQKKHIDNLSILQTKLARVLHIDYLTTRSILYSRGSSSDIF